MNLSQNFTVKGQFYNGNEFEGRRCLEIRKKMSNTERPDLIVIMMNPGSSKPSDSFLNDVLVEAKPDMTQYKIMRLMLNCDYHFAKVINLSDIIEKDSSRFNKRMKALSKKAIPHSIFDNSRTDELNLIFDLSIPVVAAWGVEGCLLGCASKAQDKLKNREIYGIKKPGCDFGYFHPLVRDKGNWTDLLTEQILERNNLI